MSKFLKATIAAAALGFCGAASAQNSDTVLRILQSVLSNGGYYNTPTQSRYYDDEQEALLRAADINRDGRLTQAEVDAYYDRRYNQDRYNGYNPYGTVGYRGLDIRDIDLNRDGYLSLAEQDAAVRTIQREQRRLRRGR